MGLRFKWTFLLFDMRVITLTTDFGISDWYVACMKGVMLRINPEIQIVDVTHLCPDQDVLRGSFILANADYFPEGTIHVAVVDPGVGSDREAIIVKLSNNQFYICPNNGLLSFLLQKYSIIDSYLIENPNYYSRPNISSTFHGRDIFAPAAAHLSLGINPSDFGRPLNTLIQLNLSAPTTTDSSVQGKVIYIDKFGNLISNIHRSILSLPIVSCSIGAHTISNIGSTYSDVSPGSSLVLFSSEDYVEISINQGNAQVSFSASISSAITLRLLVNNI